MMRDPYEVLEIPRDADEATIKKAFRKLGAKYHPDRNGDEGAEDRFKEINAAYQILSDPEKRAQFDAYGHGGHPGHGGFGGHDMWAHVQQHFQDFFGGGARQARTRGRDVRVGLNLTFVEALYGCTKRVDVRIPNVCGECDGSGAENSEMVPCEQCGGTGMHTVQRGVVTFSSNCPACVGGRRAKAPCKSCEGTGQVIVEQAVDVHVPAGVPHGAIIRQAGMGEGVHGIRSGDLHLVCDIEPHSKFKMIQRELVTEETLTIVEAVLGVDREIEMPDGSKLTVKIPRGSSHGHVIRLRGKGCPASQAGPQGDLHIGLMIDIPRIVTPRAEELLKELGEELGSK